MCLLAVLPTFSKHVRIFFIVVKNLQFWNYICLPKLIYLWEWFLQTRLGRPGSLKSTFDRLKRLSEPDVMPNMKVVLSMVLKLELPLGAAALRSAEGINPQSRFNGAT